MNILPLEASAASQVASGANAANSMGGWAILVQLVPLVLIVVVFYFLLIRPQKKRDKEIQKMRDSLQVGDEVVTVGGVIGLVVAIKEDTVVIETGSDRSKIRVQRWAIQTNNTTHDDVEEA